MAMNVLQNNKFFSFTYGYFFSRLFAMPNPGNR